jgi:hypothetical protein
MGCGWCGPAPAVAVLSTGAGSSGGSMMVPSGLAYSCGTTWSVSRILEKRTTPTRQMKEADTTNPALVSCVILPTPLSSHHGTARAHNRTRAADHTLSDCPAGP